MTRPERTRAAAFAALLCAAIPGARAGAQRAGAAAVQGAALPALSGAAVAPASDADVERVLVAPGRSRPLTLPAAVSRVMVADTSVADAVVVSDRDVVFNGRKPGETDVLVWSAGRRLHYRTVVAPAADRPQVMLSVKIAEVRRDFLKSVGVSFRARRVGGTVFGGTTGALPTTGGYYAGSTTLSDVTSAINGATTGFGTLVTDFGARGLLAMLDLEEQRGNSRTLAEPTLMAGNRDSASFLAGGEIPVPFATAGQNGVPYVTVIFKEYGVRLGFLPEILSDSVLKLHIRPEVSSIDYNNSVTLTGYKIPALLTRRMESTIDVPRDQSVVISGLMNDERQRVRTGIPGLIDLPVIGSLFSSTRWQRNESELLIVVTPVVVDPSRPRPQDVLRFQPDSTLPAREALTPRLVAPPAPPATPAPSKQP